LTQQKPSFSNTRTPPHFSLFEGKERKTMVTEFKRSAACCSTPRIIGEAYQHQGEFIELNGTKVYTAGPEHASKAVFIIYDIFGYSYQILRGADKLAQHYRVFMPAFFGEDPAPLSWMPFDGPADEQKLDDFCEGPGETQKTLAKVEELRHAFQQTYPEIEAWALAGYCWGGWVRSPSHG
jgi:dienelactone hydrolase